MASPPLVVPGSQSSSPEMDLPVPLKKFYQGEPLALGITQIFIGIIGIIFGILIHVTDEDTTSYILIMMPYWSGILYIISGSLAVAAARNPKVPLVKGMLAMNVISAITAGTGIVCLSVTLNHLFPSYVWHLCNPLDNVSQEKCYKNTLYTFDIIKGILSILTVFTFVEFCISISVASFGCKMLCRNTFTETVVVVYVTPAHAEHTPIDCKQPESP